MDLENETITTILLQKDEKAFEQVFKSYYKRLHVYAITILQDKDEAEEMVQRVFVKIWERNESLTSTGTLAAYLYRAVHNECLNYLKHQKVKSAHQLYVVKSMKNEVEHPGQKINAKELEQKINSALNELPEQCRTIFQLSRFGELKYREIASQLGLSVKTVEAQMGKALKLLRLKLAEFLTLILLFTYL